MAAAAAADAGGEQAMPQSDAPGLLACQQGMFRDLCGEDGLLVIARGLGMDRLLLSYLRMFCDRRSLVLVLNVAESDLDIFVNELSLPGIFPRTTGLPPHWIAPRVLTNETTVPAREECYQDGGVIFVTSRILVVDMLSSKIPTHLVTGIVVCSAHRVAAMSQEAFILRIFRQQNKTGFIRALSDHPEAFGSGAHQADKVMKALWVKKLYLWPRFEASIHAALSQHPPTLYQADVPLTKQMRGVQQAIEDLLIHSIKELKRLRPSLETEYLTPEQGLFSTLEQQLRRQLDPIWDTLKPSMKQLVRDIRTLRTLAAYLLEYDAVSFYHYLENLRASEIAFTKDSLWLFLDATDHLRVHARNRVYKNAAGGDGEMELVLEPNPKWKELVDILDEIKSLRPSQGGRTVICVSDVRTCRQLENVLRFGSKTVLKRRMQQFVAWRQSTSSTPGGLLQPKEAQPAAEAAQAAAAVPHTKGRRGKRRRLEMAARASGGFIETVQARSLLASLDAAMAAAMDKSNAEAPSASSTGAAAAERGRPDSAAGGASSSNAAGGGEQRPAGSAVTTLLDELAAAINGELDIALLGSADPSEDFANSFGEIPDDSSIFFYPLRGGTGEGKASAATFGGSGSHVRFARMLRDVRPRNIVMYDTDLAIVRQVEMYKVAEQAEIRIYMLMFANSFQEQRYLSSIRLEKMAFERLIVTKGHMAVPHDQDGRLGHRQEQERLQHLRPGEEESTRRAGGRARAPLPSPHVVVDIREFRSALPSMLHERSNVLEPVTLTVGDYVLSPDMCVERKSIPDLVGSLNSGRLYNQATAMSRFYRLPMLLIEFDTNKPFSLIGARGQKYGSDIDSNSVTSKLVLLTITFPRLRLLWCRSPYQTAELFGMLKKHAPEPEVERAVKIGTSGDDSEETVEERYAPEPMTLLSKLPGVTKHNLRAIMEHVPNLQVLASLPVHELQEIMGRVNGRKLFEFFQNREPL